MKEKKPQKSLKSSTSSNPDSPIKPTKRLKIKNCLIILFSCVFHYSDIITDLYLTMDTYNRQKTIESNYKEVVFMRFIFMIYALSYERYEQFFACKDLILYLKKKENKNYTLSVKDYLNIIIQLVTFTDFFLYIKAYQKDGKIFHFMFKKRLSDLCSENLLFFIFSTLAFVENTIETNNVSFMILASQMLSLTSCLIVFYQLHIQRIEDSQKFKEKKLKNLKKFPKDLQLIITNPCSLQILKFHQELFQKYSPYFQKRKQSNNNINNNQEKEVDNTVKIQEKLTKNQQNSPWKNKLVKAYVFIAVFCALTAHIYSLRLITASTKAIRIKQYLFISTICHLPQILIYIKVSLKNQTLLNKLKFLFKFIFRIPSAIFLSLYIFVLPFPIYDLPFLKGTKQVWKYNFYPTIYLAIINITQLVYNYLSLTDLFINHKNLYTVLLYSSELIDNATNPDKILYNIFLVALSVAIIDISLKFLTLIEQIYLSLKPKKPKKQHNIEQQKVKKEEVQQEQQDQEEQEEQEEQEQEEEVSEISLELEKEDNKFSFCQPNVVQLKSLHLSQIQQSCNMHKQSVSILDSTNMGNITTGRQLINTNRENYEYDQDESYEQTDNVHEYNNQQRTNKYGFDTAQSRLKRI